MSQEVVASHLHISRQTLSKYESDLSMPDMKMILKMAEFFDVSLLDILGIEEENSKDSIGVSIVSLCVPFTSTISINHYISGL